MSIRCKNLTGIGVESHGETFTGQEELLSLSNCDRKQSHVENATLLELHYHTLSGFLRHKRRPFSQLLDGKMGPNVNPRVSDF